MWFKKKNLKPSFPIGDYALNMRLVESRSLREFSEAEYEVTPRQFAGEGIYHAPDVDFIGRRWKINLGAVQGSVYKIAPFLECRSQNEAKEAAIRTLTFCNEQLGMPANQRTGLFVWDTTDGNVILQTAEAKDGFAVTLFLTAKSARDFQRV